MNKLVIFDCIVKQYIYNYKALVYLRIYDDIRIIQLLIMK